MASKEG